LGKPVQITATFKLRDTYPQSVAADVTTHIFLPEGFETVDGNLESKGDLERGRTYTLSATVRALRVGIWLLAAEADSASRGIQGYDELYATVSETGATVSRRRPPGSAIPPTRTSAPGTNAPSAEGVSLPIQVNLVVADPPSLGKTTTVSATFSLLRGYPRESAENVIAEMAVCERRDS